MKNRGNLIIGLILISCRLVFLFTDAHSPVSKKTISDDINLQNLQHQAPSLVAKNDNAQTNTASAQNLQKQNISTTMSTGKSMDYKAPENNQNFISSGPNLLDSDSTKNLSIQDLSSKISNRLQVLDTLYQKGKDENILKLIVAELLSNYQFNKINTYLDSFDIFKATTIDKLDYLYIKINSLSITDPNSMKKFMGFIEEFKNKNLISTDDYLFYQGMEYLRNNNYDLAMQKFQGISNQIYSNFIKQVQTSITTFDNQKGMPSYYKDSLIALAAMKNGYFSLANKLATDAVLHDNKYILPYQILAYSSFLTQNREKAISYFYELLSLDPENQNKYNFYIGISNYWLGSHDKSVMMLYQLINNDYYKTDVYRYLLLNYQQMGKKDKMVQIWQKLLGESNLSESDFKYFYDIAFYGPFSQGNQSEIYSSYSQLAYDFVSMCYDKFGDKNDTCMYGSVGLDIVNGDRYSIEDNLLYLSQNYPQASIYQALGDLYNHKNLKTQAKNYYLKAISLSSDSIQEGIMKDSLLKLME